MQMFWACSPGPPNRRGTEQPNNTATLLRERRPRRYDAAAVAATSPVLHQ
jgi:hypothetical protein